MRGGGLGLSAQGRDQRWGFCEHGNELAFSIKRAAGNRLIMAYRGGSPRPIRMVFFVAKVTLGQVLRLPRFLLSSLH